MRPKTGASRFNGKHGGIAMIWLVISFLALMVIMVLAIEAGRVYITAHQLQNAADSAALVGARWVPDPNSPSPGYNARLMAQQYARLNDTLDTALAKTGINLNIAGDTVDLVTINMALPPAELSELFNDGDVYIGRYIDHDRLFIKNDPAPDAMLVVGRKDDKINNKLPLPLASMFGVQDATIQRYAVAKAFDPYGAGLLALGRCGCPGIIFSGAGSADDLVIFGGGSMYVNAIAPNAIEVDGNISTNLDRVYTVGGIDPDFYNVKNDVTYTDIHTGSEFEPDPYASLPDAVYNTTPDLGTISTTGTYLPGYYSGGIQIAANQEITLLPGDYYLDSKGQAASLSMNNGSITGEGVTLHIIGDANYGVNIDGGDLTISAPTSGTYAGIGIFQKRDPDYNCEVSCEDPWQQAFPMSVFGGNGTTVINGAVYMPHTRVELGGTGYISMTRTVGDRFLIRGSSEKVVHFKGVPKIAETSYLVE